MTLPADARVAKRVGVGRFRDSDSFYDGTDENDRPVGSTSMTVVAVLHALRRLDADSGIQFTVNHSPNAGTSNGWLMAYVGGSGFSFAVSDGGGSNTQPAISATVAAATTLVQAMSYDGSTCRARVLGRSASAAASVAGYTPPNNGRELNIGERSNGLAQPARDVAVLGFLGTDSQALGATGLADLEAEIIDAIEQGRDLDSFPDSGFVPEVYYDARDLLISGSTPAGTWSDRLGNGVDLTKNGAPELFDLPARF